MEQHTIKSGLNLEKKSERQSERTSWNVFLKRFDRESTRKCVLYKNTIANFWIYILGKHNRRRRRRRRRRRQKGKASCFTIRCSRDFRNEFSFRLCVFESEWGQCWEAYLCYGNNGFQFNPWLCESSVMITISNKLFAIKSFRLQTGCEYAFTWNCLAGFLIESIYSQKEKHNILVFINIIVWRST